MMVLIKLKLLATKSTKNHWAGILMARPLMPLVAMGAG
jgi:hypothetical protein